MERANQLALTFLLNAGWQIALIAAVTALCGWLLRETSARYRYWLWVAALLISIGLPVLTASNLFDGNVFSGQPRSQSTVRSTNATSPSPFQPSPVDTTTQGQSLLPSPLEEAGPHIRINKNVTMALIAFYFLFQCYLSLRLLKAWLRARTISRNAYSIEIPDPAQAVIAKCQAAMGVKKVQVLCSTDVTAPITIGSLNPLVIIPEQLLREANVSILTSAIGHELAHILRRDYLLNLIYELIYLPLSFHPAAALVRRRIRQTREICCDELVIERLVSAEIYARSLVQLASSAADQDRFTTNISVGVTNAHILEERIMTMLRRSKISSRRSNLLLIAVALIFAVPCATAASLSLPISFATQSGTVIPKQKATQLAQRQQIQASEDQKRRELREGAPSIQVAELEMRRRGERQAVVTPPGNASQETKRQESWLQQETQERDSGSGEERELGKKSDTAGSFAQAFISEYMRRIMNANRQTELAKKINITMQEALQIVTNQQPGKVLACSLEGEQGKVFYHVHVLPEDGSDSTTIHIFISAIDGQVIRTERENR